MEMRSEDVVSSYFVRGRICKSILYRSRNCIRHLCSTFFPLRNENLEVYSTLSLSRVVFCDECNCVPFFLRVAFFFVIDSSKTHDRTQNWLPRQKKRGEGGSSKKMIFCAGPVFILSQGHLYALWALVLKSVTRPLWHSWWPHFFPEKDRAEQKLSHFVNNYIYEGSETFIPEAFEHETEMDCLPFFIIFRDPRKPLFLICSSRKYSIYASIYRSAL